MPATAGGGELHAPSGEVDHLAVPLTFEPNEGQTSAAVDFLSRGDGYTVFLRDGGAVLMAADDDRAHALSLDFVNANPLGIGIGVGQDPLPGRSHYLRGNDRAGWQTDIPHFGSVLYRGVYPDVDLRYYGNQRRLEYDLIVQPGGIVPDIRLAVAGALEVTIDAAGDLVLVLDADADPIRFRAPYSYQVDAGGTSREIASQYQIHADGTVGFVVGAYDPTRTLVIDPVLDYGTFLGGTGTDRVKALALDAAGNIYVAGHTSDAATFPTSVGPQGTPASWDAFVTKIAADGTSLVYSTVIGGANLDDAEAIAVDAAGYAYVTGNTSSSDFPLQDPFDNSLGGTYDACVFVLRPAGDLLEYSTFWGGSGPTDEGLGIAVDASGTNVYVAGSVNSGTGFTTTAGVVDQTFAGSTEAYVAKFDAFAVGAASLVWSTFVGGSGLDIAYGLAVDAAGNATLVGTTDSGDFQTTAGAFQGSLTAREDAFVAKLNTTATAYSYASYLGGSSDDQAESVDLGPAGEIYVAGYAKSDFGTDFPTTAGAFDESHNGNWDGFLAVFDPVVVGNGSLLYSTVFGGTSLDRPLGVAVGADGVGHVTGYVMSNDFPVSGDADDGSLGGTADGFLFSCDPGGGGAADRIYATYLGGATADYGNEARITPAGEVYIGGYTDSSDFPTSAGAYDRALGGTSQDGFVSRISGFGVALEGHWTFDVDASDASGNNHHGTLVGDAVIDTDAGTNQIGGGKLSLDGNGDLVDLAAHAGAFAGYTQGTIHAWVNLTTTGESTVLDLSDGAGSEYATFFIQNGNLRWNLRAGGTSHISATSTATINDGTWHQVALTTDASGNRLFIDGVELTGGAVSYSSGSAATTEFFSAMSTVDWMSIGGYTTGSPAGEFTGLIDDVRVYGRALSAGEIADLYAAAGPGAHDISGMVFEDADFAGTATDYDGGTGDLALANVDVELYGAADLYLASTTSDVNGEFTFAGLADGTYKVRVRSATIGDADTPPAGGLHPTVPATWPYPLPDLTWGHTGALVGGQDPAADDTATADDAGPGDTWVTVTVSGGDVSGVNLGFSYEIIVNNDDDANADDTRSKQGSLRQFIKNSNAIVGVETSWFQIP